MNKFRITQPNRKMLDEGLKFKFAISVKEKFFSSDIFLFLNIVSELKNILNWFQKPLDVDELYEILEIDHIPRHYIDDASELVFGTEKKCQKVTVIDKSCEEVNKFIRFKSNQEALKWHSDYKMKLKNFNFVNNEISIPNLSFEKIIKVSCLNSTVQITSVYEKNLRKIGFIDLSSLCSMILAYVKNTKGKERHGDLKIFNIRKMSNGNFYVFDLENISKKLDDKEMYDTFIEPFKTNRFYSFKCFFSYIYFSKKLAVLNERRLIN